jgi:Na+/melibiose symporter-like transporter
MIVAGWKVFTKAGQPGWASIIPFYNVYVMLTIVGKPGWWLLLFFIPIVNLVIGIIVTLELAKRFGKSGGFAVGLILLPFIFYLILAFGSATYTPAPASAA